MRRIALMMIAALAALLCSTPTADSAAPVVVANWQMNEPAGSRTMIDSSGDGNNGVISPDATAQGLTHNGEYYDWNLMCPSCAPPTPGRVIQVADNPNLEIPDPTVPWTLEFRFRTNKGYGNLMQKGQGTTAGGQIKIENPTGLTRCVWKGANGSYVSIRGTKLLNDREWHVVQCVHTETRVSQYVDGVLAVTKAFRTGPINNAKPFVVGGKRDCNNVTVTCDYYTGSIDYIKITRG